MSPKRTYADLLAIFEAAPRHVIDGKIVGALPAATKSADSVAGSSPAAQQPPPSTRHRTYADLLAIAEATPPYAINGKIVGSLDGASPETVRPAGASGVTARSSTDDPSTSTPPAGTTPDPITNVETEEQDNNEKTVPLSMTKILNRINEATGDWPRRVGNSLFIDDPHHGLHYLTKTNDLFAWLHRFNPDGTIEWHRLQGCVSREEVFSELQRTATNYAAIERFPHFPAMADHYYRHPPIEPGDGTALRDLVARFSPATTIDADLILALFASAAWGGAGGTRPAFVVVSDDGRGVGKSKLIEIVGILFGGIFTINANDRAADISKRLLTSEVATKRIMLFDNVKTNRLSWSELESLITCRDISGHRLYSGERTRPNTLLWCLTLNGPSMSRDMAQRSVIIKLRRPMHCGTWEDSIKAFVEDNRWRIMADLADFFRRPASALARHGRWATWEREILARLPEPSEAQQVILERQADVNGDDEEIADVVDYFRRELERLGYNPNTESVHIPNEIAREWFIRANGATVSMAAVTRTIRQAHNEGTLPQIKVNPSRARGRGLMWLGKGGHEVQYEIMARLQQNRWQEDRHWDR